MLPIIPVMQLLLAVDTVAGRKKLQKMVHILKELGAPFEDRFEYSYYGMYSTELRGEIEQLVAENLIEEKETEFKDNKKGFTTTATPAMGVLLAQHGLSEPQPWASLATDLNKMSSTQLEGISTILFLKARGHEGAAIKKRLLELKPHLAEDADFCCQTAEELSARRLVA